MSNALDAAEMDALKAERDDLERAIAEIKAQLSAAKARVFSEGVYSDPEWFARADAARMFKARRLNELNRLIGAADREHRRGRNDSWEREFVRQAKIRLRQETYDELVAATSEAMAGDETGQETR